MYCGPTNVRTAVYRSISISLLVHMDIGYTRVNMLVRHSSSGGVVGISR